MAPHRIAVIGIGKIAQDQHLPVIADDPDFTLAAVVSQRGLGPDGVPVFHTLGDLIDGGPAVDAVAIATPPGARYGLARLALDRGLDVLLEKPPVPTTLELQDLAAHAAASGRVVFTTWHSQYNAAVREAQRRLGGQTIRRLAITWKEDVRQWHPGQDWIWQQAGFGVFDPGINALSILTAILDEPVFVREAVLTYPANKSMPIAAALRLSAPVRSPDAEITAAFDWRQQGEQSWDIHVETQSGTQIALTRGGTVLAVDGKTVVAEPSREYQGIYRQFSDLLHRRESLVDDAPFRLVADCFMVGRREVTAPFYDLVR